MKKIVFFLLAIYYSVASFGQQYDYIIGKDTIDIKSIIPCDYDSFWYDNDGCAVINNTYSSFMDTFNYLYRQPFSKYLLGNYYWGHVINIDSVTLSVPFFDERNDSIAFVFMTFKLLKQYVSPYNKDMYSFPLPIDIMEDSKNNGSLYQKLIEQIDNQDEIEENKKICVMMTKQELSIVSSIISSVSPKNILLRATEDINDSHPTTIFCFQLFINDFSIDNLLSKNQISRYRIARYLEMCKEIKK